MGLTRQIQGHERTPQDARRTSKIKIQAASDEVAARQPHRCEAAIDSPKEKHGHDAGPWNARI